MATTEPQMIRKELSGEKTIDLKLEEGEAVFQGSGEGHFKQKEQRPCDGKCSVGLKDRRKVRGSGMLETEGRVRGIKQRGGKGFQTMKRSLDFIRIVMYSH